MHKTILAFIVSTSALTYAHATTEIYGSLELGMTRSYNHNPAEGNMIFTQVGKNQHGQAIYRAQRMGQQGLAIGDYGSNIGVRGSESFGDNAQLIFDLRWAFDAAADGENGEGFESEVTMLGLETSYGTFTIGRLESPFHNVITEDSVINDFYAVGTSAAIAATGDILLGRSGSLNTFDAEMWEYLSNAAIYTSPIIGELSFTAGIVASHDQETYGNNRNIDLYTLGVSYEHASGFYAKLGYFSADIDQDSKRVESYGSQVGFRTEDWGITGDYAYGRNQSAQSFGTGNAHSEFFWDDIKEQSANGNYKHTAQGWDIGGYWTMGADHNTTLRATYGQATAKKRQSSKTANNREENRLNTWAMGLEQTLSDRTAIWAEYEYTTIKQKFNHDTQLSYIDHSLTSQKFKNQQFSIGIRHDF